MSEFAEMMLRLVVAGALGGLIGAEREYRGKVAGTRTHLLVALGSALMLLVSQHGFGGNGDPGRVAAQIVSGIGFIGAGAIMVDRKSVHGLTTAAGIWVAAGIGMAAAAGLYSLAVATTFLALVGLEVFGILLFSDRRRRQDKGDGGDERKCRDILCFVCAAAFAASAGAASGTWDADVSDFPRAAGEIGDSGRIMRAVAAAGQGGVVWFPRGDYAIDERLVISNQVSLLLHKSACLKAMRQMPFVLTYVGRQMEDGGHAGAVVDHNLFIRGGVFDGNGCAGGVQAMGLRHFTLADSTYRNARGVGLQLGDPALPNTAAGGYEVVANNLYFVCTRPGLAGNVGLLTYIGDSHFTDIVVVDHTVGICDRRWSNRFTRCHVWGGPVCDPATKRPEYLPGSIAFDLHGYDAVLDNCYADTAMTGFNVCTMVRLVNCASHNNWRFRMDGPTVINHQKGLLIVTGGRFDKTSPRATPYRRGADAGDLVWRDNTLERFEPADMRELEDALKKRSVGRVSPASGPLADAPAADSPRSSRPR